MQAAKKQLSHPGGDVQACLLGQCPSNQAYEVQICLLAMPALTI